LTNIYSFEVDTKELEVSNIYTIDFENYSGPYLYINSVEEIRNIGRTLAQGLIKGSDGKSVFFDKYSMYHIQKKEFEENLKSTDVFVIEDNALIDNTSNIILILSQYLIEFYNYSLEDSRIIAKMILYYNAVYRGDSKHYNSTYTSSGYFPLDLTHLGIDTRYYNWPGQTNIYIPISNEILINKNPIVDSDTFFETETMEYIRDNSPDSISFREEIIEYKEKELMNRALELKEQKEEIIENISILEKQIEVQTDDLEVKEIQASISELKSEINEIEAKEEKIKNVDNKVLNLRDDVAEDKNKDIVIERNTIKHLFLNIKKNSKGDLGELVYIDEYANIIAKSQVNSIRNNKIYIYSNSIYTIAGGYESNHLISLLKISRDSLATIATSDIPVYEKSSVHFEKDKIFVVSPINDKYFIAMLDNNLKLLGFSALPVLQDTYIVTKENQIYIQGNYNNIIFSNFEDFVLKE
jgi:hypothetical protein